MSNDKLYKLSVTNFHHNGKFYISFNILSLVFSLFLHFLVTQYFPKRISYSIKKANNQQNITNSKIKKHTIAASHFNRGDVV